MPAHTTSLIGTALFLLALGSTTAMALTPLARPTGHPDIALGQSAPFVGAWSVTLPTMEVTEPSTGLAICALPVRIQAADDRHIFYLGPRETEPDAAIALVASDDGTEWEPIAGGPAFFAIWINPDSFYLYDAMADGDPDWGQPYIYDRCP
ncbi:hypothetical protein [Devosia sp. CAU 1758]